MKGYFERVYELVAQIPEGKVMTYGQIARILGKPANARVVGWAMRVAPRGLPAHRVLNQKGNMAPPDIFGDGLQKNLLIQEGVIFKSDGNVDLNQCLWEGPIKLS